MASRRYNTRNRRKAKQPCASYYVGYVEDQETPEMIMKKFEEMEKFKEALREEKKKKDAESNIKSKVNAKAEISDSDNDDDDDENDNNNNEMKNNDNIDSDMLNGSELASLFTQTSSFSVHSVLQGNSIMMDKPVVSHDGFVIGYDDKIEQSELVLAADFDIKDELEWDSNDMEYQFDDYGAMSDSDFWEEFQASKKKNRQYNNRNNRSKRSFVSNKNSIDYCDSFGNRAKIGESGAHGKKKKEHECKDIVNCKVPPHPLPLSWANVMKPYFNPIINSIDTTKDAFLGMNYIEHNNLIKLKCSDLPHSEYIAGLIDCPFDLTNSILGSKPGIIKLEDYKSLPMGNLVKNGMLFIWTPSELIHEIMEIAEDWGFNYADHACWVKKTMDNKLAVCKGKYINISKQTLLLFRKGKFELRHQRTSDVHFNFVRYHRKYTKQELKPSDYVSSLIEKILPATIAHIPHNNVLNDIKNKENNNQNNNNNNNNNNDDNSGKEVKSKILHLWAPQGEKRRGWTTMVDKKHLEFLEEQERL